MASVAEADMGGGGIAEIYDRDGFVFPIDVVSAAEAEAVRADLEAAEKELKDDPKRLAVLRAYPDRVLPSFDKLISESQSHRCGFASAWAGPDGLERWAVHQGSQFTENRVMAPGSHLLGP